MVEKCYNVKVEVEGAVIIAGDVLGSLFIVSEDLFSSKAKINLEDNIPFEN